MVFSRGRGRGRHAKDEQAQPDTVEAQSMSGPATGPYDVSEAPTGVRRLDLGSLQIPAIEGVEVRVQANPDGVIQQVVLANRGSALQLGVFAAPRSEGIWDEVRAEIAESLRRDGATVRETTGDYGPELVAQVRTPEGHTHLRFVGVDGPRWMVRALYQGAAADPAAAGPLAEALQGLVVDRGQEAKPVREPLPLRLPREIADQAGQAPAAQASASTAPAVRLPGSPTP